SGVGKDSGNGGDSTRDSAFAVVAQAAARLREAGEDIPLTLLAEEAGYSASHFQRVFAQWMGLSPKRYSQYLAARRAQQLLQQGDDLLSASLDAGLSGPGRLHDLMVTLVAATPGEVRSGGEGLIVSFGIASTPFGPAFVAQSERGLMKLSFLRIAEQQLLTQEPSPLSVDNVDAALAQAELHVDWPAATLRRDDDAATDLVQRLFASYRAPEPIPLFIRGTQFQVRVWEALLRIPEGQLTTYGELAAVLGQPSGARAVGGAVGANPVALLIPCHRVIRASGELGGYRWGEPRKRLLLAAELAWQSPSTAPEK
ncbi:MAG TPA: methylated-DNA--[protein]-cysteine S-methyltransferase, partial [Moraxellaceae bacterium]|nr:methylated-DNA--[protein]-cysteine S-methyltransferase [Moraxellaceae bacterium]